MVEVETIKYGSGKVRYCDCLHEDYGLPSLEEDSFDLGFTDPVWGKDMKENTRKYVKDRTLDNSNKVHFNDVITDDFTRAWFTELNRVCKRTVLVISDELAKHLIKEFYPEYDPTIIPVLWKNGFSKNKRTKHSRRSLYLVYGEFPKGSEFPFDYLAKKYYGSTTNLEPFTLQWGFCSNQRHFNHPSPKGLKIPLHILRLLNPESILDPFAGSGSYIYAASIFDIPFLAYEIDKDKKYREDIAYRFAEQTIKEWI
jgi:DNA modification methylase